MIKGLAVRALAAPPVYPLLRARALWGRPLTVLCYHTLGPDRGGPDGWTLLRQGNFRDQLAFLRRHYDIVDLDTALTHETPTKRPQAVLTFDDGDTGLATYLAPIIETEALPVTIYVATEQIETGRPYWFDRVVNALQSDAPIRLDLTDLGLGAWGLSAAPGKARWQVLGAILQALKEVDPAHREELTEAIEARAPSGDASGVRLGPMTRDALARLAAIPHVTIGAHSHCHNLLDQIPLEEARKSVARSRELLGDWTGQEVRHFAYPNGNHTAALREMVAGLGFASAAALGMTTAPRDADRFALPRIAIGRYETPARFRLRLAGL